MAAQDKKQKQRPRVSKERHLSLLRNNDAAKASKYLKHFSEIEKGEYVIALFCRVSTRSQKQNMKSQIEFCKHHVMIHPKIEVTDFKIFSVVAHANSSNARQVLDQAQKYVASTGGIILAESSSRFVRNGGYNPITKRNARVTHAEFEELMRHASGITLATIHPPDLPEAEENSLQKKRGMAPHDKRGGRPPKKYPGYKKEQRLKDQHKAIALRKSGMSLAAIAKAFCQNPRSNTGCERHRTKNGH